MATEFNCDCVDANPAKTLEEYRTDMLIDLGFATIASNPPPGMALFCDLQLNRAQRMMYLKYPALRTNRIFVWTLQQGVRYYGMLDNTENWTDITATMTIATPGVVTVAGGVPNDRLVYFTSTGALPTGITAYYRYYVVNASGNTFQLSLTEGGAAIATTGTQSGTITASYSPSALCVFDMNPYAKIDGAWVIDLNNAWLPIGCGINPAWYTTEEQQGIPARYEIRQCLEVFPAPSGAGYRIAIKGHFGLKSFTADEDKPTIDGDLVYMWALANAKKHYGHPDADSVAAQAREHLSSLITGTHLTRRYIPGESPLGPYPAPIFLPLNGAPP